MTCVGEQRLCMLQVLKRISRKVHDCFSIFVDPGLLIHLLRSLPDVDAETRSTSLNRMYRQDILHLEHIPLREPSLQGQDERLLSTYGSLDEIKSTHVHALSYNPYPVNPPPSLYKCSISLHENSCPSLLSTTHGQC